MSSGLIWAGLGKGIAEAGNSFGSAMMRQIADDRALDRMEKQAELADQRAERNAVRAEERIEAKSKRDAADYVASKDGAADVRTKREVGLLTQGASEEDIETIRNMPPEARKVYQEAGMLPKKDERLMEAEDSITAAGSRGASGDVIKMLYKDKESVLAQIKAESVERVALAKEDRRDARQQEAIAAAGERQDKVLAQSDKKIAAAISSNTKGTGNKEALSYLESTRKDVNGEIAEVNRVKAAELKALNERLNNARNSEKAGIQAQIDTVKAEAVEKEKTLKAKKEQLDLDYAEVRKRVFGDNKSTSQSSEKPKSGTQSSRLSQFKVIR